MLAKCYISDLLEERALSRAGNMHHIHTGSLFTPYGCYRIEFGCILFLTQLIELSGGKGKKMVIVQRIVLRLMSGVGYQKLSAARKVLKNKVVSITGKGNH